MKGRLYIFLVLMLVGATAMVTTTVEAVRTGRIPVESEKLARLVPAGTEGSSFVPSVLLDNVGWVIAAGVVWIVVAALLMGRNGLERG